jgi:chlorite dismutase
VPPAAPNVHWVLRGVTSNLRYTTGAEQASLSAQSPGLNRHEATSAALIPIRKNPQWWMLPQDARRNIFEEQSRHIAIGMDYVPAVARRLHHCRDLNEPFDFLTWFEYAPSDAAAFEHMVARLRNTEEWRYVDREIDIRLTRL